MATRLVLCLDGTWNTADAEEITNIVRIRDFVDPNPTTASGVDEQRVYYHNGVGTGLSTKDKFIGGATGLGLGHNIRSAYKFLSLHYEEGVEVYIFGFSRGSFTARSLLGYISASGLLKPEHCSSQNENRAWQFYRTSPDDRFPQEFEALAKLSHPNVRIRCVGVFDTVGALGVPVEVFRSWNSRRFQFHDVTLGTNIDYAFHALAIDEKRGPFQASLWQYPNHRRFKHVEQVWFPGVHSNIGGGYPDRGLSDRTLHWMMSRIEKMNVGLKFVPGWNNTLSPSASAKLYESRTAAYAWSRLRPMIRVINQQHPALGRLPRFSALPRHAIPLGEMLDAYALLRWKLGEQQGSETYQPPNLEAALDATFNLDQPFPIPIVNDDGEPLDWVNNDNDLAVLKQLLPTKYARLVDQTVKRFRGVQGSEVFSQPYQGPRPSLSA